MKRAREARSSRGRRSWPGRLAAACLAVGSLGAFGLACPSRNLEIDINSNGLVTVLAACDALGHICDFKGDVNCDRIFCDWHPVLGCQVKNPCTLSVPDAHPYQSNTATALQLILLSTGPTQLANAGPCLCFDEMDFSCAGVPPDAGDTAADCWSASINAKLAAGIPDGLTFGGFKSPDEGILAMAWFQPPQRGTMCADLPDAGTSLCAEQNMVACAGLGAPPGTATYDITCASCQGGLHSAIGNDNGPCVTAPNECFLQTCAEAVFGAPSTQ